MVLVDEKCSVQDEQLRQVGRVNSGREKCVEEVGREDKTKKRRMRDICGRSAILCSLWSRKTLTLYKGRVKEERQGRDGKSARSASCEGGRVAGLLTDTIAIVLCRCRLEKNQPQTQLSLQWRSV